MTLSLFVFDLNDSFMLHICVHAKQDKKQRDRRDQANHDSGTNFFQRGLVCKILNVIVSLAYVIYDAYTQYAPGTGSLVLVVLACLSEVFLLVIGLYTLWCSKKAKMSQASATVDAGMVAL